jgi:hypothetical protein
MSFSEVKDAVICRRLALLDQFFDQMTEIKSLCNHGIFSQYAQHIISVRKKNNRSHREEKNTTPPQQHVVIPRSF